MKAKSEAVADSTRGIVRERYGEIATKGGCGGGGGSSSSSSSCCGGPSAGATAGGGASGCCGDSSTSEGLGYTAKELASLPEGANLGLGCGNPTALLSLRPGQAVLDLGSGAGIDCFLASRKVGARGRVIGVDMTPQMVEKARANAREGRHRNVEFRLGEIEHLPVADQDVDVVISNCVINLAPDKGKVYREAFRVLRPGGRFAVSDVVATRPISAKERQDPALWSSCSSGALQVREVKRLLRQAGFTDIQVDVRRPDQVASALEGQASLGVYSADIQATKPGRR